MESILLRRGKTNPLADSDRCKQCKSHCCTGSIPLSPDDFSIDLNDYRAVKRLFITGFFATNGWGISTKFVRDWEHNPCVFWSEKGCKLPYDTRPLLCRSWGVKICERSKEEYCGFRLGPTGHSESWGPYRVILKKLAEVRKYSQSEIIPSTAKQLDFVSFLQTLNSEEKMLDIVQH